MTMQYELDVARTKRLEAEREVQKLRERVGLGRSDEDFKKLEKKIQRQEAELDRRDPKKMLALVRRVGELETELKNTIGEFDTQTKKLWETAVDLKAKELELQEALLQVTLWKDKAENPPVPLTARESHQQDISRTKIRKSQR